MKFSKKQNLLTIGDLVILSFNFKKSRYKTGEAPIYQWVIGHRGYIVVGQFSNDQTAIVAKIMSNGPGRLRSESKNAFKLITDSGEVGWFCEGENWLVKN